MKFNKNYIKSHTLGECLDHYKCNYLVFRIYCAVNKISCLSSRGAYDRTQELKTFAGTDTDERIGEQLGCSRYVVLAYRYANGIKAYKKHSKTKSIDYKAIAEEYNELGSLSKVAKLHNVSKESVRLWLKKSGFEKVDGKYVV